MAYPSGQVIFRTVIGVSILTVLFFVGRPVYWKVSAALTDMKASGSTVGEVQKLEASELETKEVESTEKGVEGDALEEDKVSDAVSKDSEAETDTETNTNTDTDTEAEADPNSDPNTITEKITEGGETGSEAEEGTELKDNVEKIIEDDEKLESSAGAEN